MATRLRARLRLLALGVCVAAAPFALSAQRGQPPPDPAQQPVFRTSTTLVPVDVRVVDKDGQPVTDLAISDFTIRENGTPQTISHFATRAFTPDAPASFSARPMRAASAMDLTGENRRTFLIVLGRGRLQEPSKGLDAMIHLVRERLLPQDLVAVAAWNRATEFTTDHEAIAQVIERFKPVHGLLEAQTVLCEKSLRRIYGNCDLEPSQLKKVDAIFGTRAATHTLGVSAADVARIDEQTRRASDRALAGQPLDPIDQAQFDLAGGNLDDFLSSFSQTSSDLSALYRGVEYLRGLAGEKQLIFVSEYGVSLPQMEDDRGLARAASDGRVVLNFVYAGGMPVGDPGAFFARPANPVRAGQTARAVTEETGGLFFGHQFKTASTDVDRIDAATRFEYELGYYPRNQNWDGRYRRIAVTVNRPGLTVLSRDGFFARRDLPAFDRKGAAIYTRVANAAGYPKNVDDVKISLATPVAHMTGRRGEVQVEMTIDLARVDFQKQDGRNVASIEVAAFAVTDRQQTAGHTWQTLQLSFTDARLAEVRATGLAHRVTVPVTAPAHDLKVVVYDYSADVLGTTVKRIK